MPVQLARGILKPILLTGTEYERAPIEAVINITRAGLICIVALRLGLFLWWVVWSTIFRLNGIDIIGLWWFIWSTKYTWNGIIILIVIVELCF